MKIRLFALAKELDIDSKLLIEHCAKIGIPAKNVLASISPEERDALVAHLKSQSGGLAAPVEEKPPVREREMVPPELSKARPLRNMSPMVARPQPGRGRPMEPVPQRGAAPSTKPEIEQDVVPVVEARVAPSEPPQVEEPPPVEPAVVEPTSTNVSPAKLMPAKVVPTKSPPVEVAPVASPKEPEPVEQPPVDVVAEQPPEAPEPPAVDEGDQGGAPQKPGPSRPAPISRSDYVPATGAGRQMRVMQPMQARGTTDTQGSRQLEKKPAKPRPSSLPQIAAIPEFKGPPVKASKPEEPKAQKPDFKLTPNDLRGASPLSEHLRKQQAEKSKKRVDDESAEAGKKDVKRGPGDRTAGQGLEGTRQQRKTKRPVPGEEDEGDKGGGIRFRPKLRRGPASVQLKTSAEIDLPITVRTLSEALGRPAKSLMSVLWARGDMVTINTALTEEEALDISMELGVDLKIRKEKDLEDELNEIFEEADPPETLVARPPIVTILGHVDHGKTTLVDKIRSANVAASEFGGITQHIAAYQVEHNGQKITFVDTPGHAAFGEMRARGANVTDIVVLVVAGNDGVMPQTVECIAHARAAGVPIVVALNKIDLPDVNEQRVLQDLAANDVLASEWGGDIEVVRTSGMTGKGVPDLLDTILLTAELHELQANPGRPACGVCLEAFRDEGRGPLAWLINQKGTLKVGDVVLCGEAYGRIRAMYNEWNQELTEAPPSSPVKIAGLDIVPKAGDRFLAVDDIDLVREIAESRRQQGRTEQLASRSSKRTLEDILNRAKDGEIQDLYLVVKADTPGSMEALKHEINKFEHPEVRVKVIHDGIGGVNESDVYLAAASNAVIVAFHVIAEDRAEQLAQAEGVDVRRYNIIYEVIDDIRNTLEGMLRPEKKEVITGRAIVLRLFSISKFGTIAGCRVLNGTIERSHRINLIREQKVMNSYGIGSLRREKDDVREVREGMECGIRLEGFNDVKEGDLFEAYKIEEVRRTLE